MVERRFTELTSSIDYYKVWDDVEEVGLTVDEVVNTLNDLSRENLVLKQELKDVRGELVMLDNCDNWDYDRMKHTVVEIAEVIGYNGTINPRKKRGLDL